MCSCDIDKESGIPINAMKIGEFKSSIPIYTCCDSRKSDWKGETMFSIIINIVLFFIIFKLVCGICKILFIKENDDYYDFLEPYSDDLDSPIKRKD